MTGATRPRRSFWGLLAVLIAVAFARPADGADTDLDRVLAALKRRQDQATVIRIRAEGTLFVPRGSGTAQFGNATLRLPTDAVSPPNDIKIEKKQDFLIDYPNRRFRQLYSENQDGKFESWILAYDGEKSYGTKIDIPIDQADGLRPSKMSINSGGKHIEFFNSFEWPYFLSQGFILTKQGQKYYWSDLRVPIEPEEIYLFGRETFGGQACAVLRTFPIGQKGSESCNEYRVAIDDGAVRQTTFLVGGKKKFEITIDYRWEGDRLAPTRWTHESFAAKSPKVAKWESFTVTRVEFDPPVSNGTFTLTPEAGTVVKEKQFPDEWDQYTFVPEKDAKTRVYRADESGRLVEGELVGGEFKPRRRYLWWVIGGGIGLLVLTAVGIVYRTRRRRTTPFPAGPPEPTGEP